MNNYKLVDFGEVAMCLLSVSFGPGRYDGSLAYYMVCFGWTSFIVKYKGHHGNDFRLACNSDLHHHHL